MPLSDDLNMRMCCKVDGLLLSSRVVEVHALTKQS